MEHNNKAAMEMSVGTIVTVVLLMAVLISGLIVIRSIFPPTIDNINSIDQSVKNEINKLFSQDDARKIVVYPATRQITIKKGDDNLGFGFSIRNLNEKAQVFTYTLKASEVSCKESLKLSEADDLIGLGAKSSVSIPAGSIQENPQLVLFNIPSTTPPCDISYSLSVDDSKGVLYSSVQVILTIKSA